MDVLSEVLKAVKLEGAIYYNAEFTAPWSFHSPPSRKVACVFAPAGRHVIIYHLVTEGRGHASLAQGSRIPLAAGEVIIFPHGDAHIIGNGNGVKPVRTEGDLPKVLADGIKLTRGGGGGELTTFVCGYMSCDPQLSQVVLAGLPPIFKVNIREDATGQWLENSIRFSASDASASHEGGAAVLAKLAEVLFVETIRRYIAGLPAGQTGWLAGTRDPAVAKSLALMHRDPSHAWTIADLAREVGISRSVLAERFRHYLGEPPISYLTRWRLLLGAQMLRSGSRSVAEIADETGYDSEASFNRAFKREYGIPPARYRTETREQGDVVR